MGPASNRRETLLAAMLPVVALSLLNVFYKEPLYRLGPAWYWAADVLQFVVAPLASAWFLLRPAGIGLQALGLRRARQARVVPWGTTFFLAAAVFALSWPVFKIASYFSGDTLLLPQLLPSPGLMRMLLAFYMATTAALVEEVVFRALPWLYLRECPRLERRVPVYLVGSTIVFALAHSEQGLAGMVAAAWFGWLAAAYYLHLRTLWPAVLAHLALDLLAYL